MSELKEKQVERVKLTPPKKWKVVYVNDDFTPFDFVIMTLMKFFNKSTEEAFAITQQVHESGKGIAGIFTKEIALTKAEIVNQTAQANDFPLKLTIEEA